MRSSPATRPLLRRLARICGGAAVLAATMGCPDKPSSPATDAAVEPTSSAAPAGSAASASTPEPPAPTASASAGPTIPPDDDVPPTTIEEQRRVLYLDLEAELGATPAEVAAVRAIVEPTHFIGNGNPKVSHHAMTRAQCRAVRAGLDDTPVHAPCSHRYMVPLYDPAAGQTAADAQVCIDEFEFPGIPCAYPVVYPTSREAALMCSAVGKRICDAHEWEGGCAGALHPVEAEYEFGKPRPYATWLHNKHREVVWAYGPHKEHTNCATLATKSEKCAGGGYTTCGTHTWPAGSFPKCVSPLGVYDQHGNAAEHMNLALAPDQLASRGGTGATEMKGSWFIFAREEAHEDDCRWRAKDWHPSNLMDEDSHRNYHLGFRCCADVPRPP
jgi:formylglycine-generating enzyme